MIKRPFFSVPDLVGVHARNRPTAIAWQTQTESVDWQTFNAAVTESARALQAVGVEKGHIVAFLSGSSLWAWTHIFGALRAGAVLAPLNTMLHPKTLAVMLADSGARTLLVSKDYSSLAEELLDAWESDRSGPMVLTEADLGDWDFRARTGKDNEEWASGHAALIGPDDAFNIIYSSGTTGTPKGIVHTHGARARMGAMAASLFRARATACVLLTTPAHTNGTWLMVLPMIYVGGTIILSSGFTPESFLNLAQEHRPDIALLVPTMAQLLIDDPRAQELDWSCFEFVLTAGAPMQRRLKERVRALTGNRLGELWGFTEGVATVVQPHEMGDHLDSVGRAAPESDVRVIDENLHEVPAGVEGELVGRSSWMMARYHNRPDATEQIVWRSPEGFDFLRTGDIGMRDEDGWVQIRGRAKEMIISGALNVYPADIEEVVCRHGDVVDCAVIGTPHPKWGESPVAFVQLRRGAVLAASELREWANGQLSKHQRLHALQIEEELPRNALGKVVKTELADLFEARSASASG